jgi:hypothetical protein
MTFWIFDFRFWIGSHDAGLKSELSGKTAATSDNGLNGAQRLNGALAVERFELTKMIPPNLLAREDRVIK